MSKLISVSDEVYETLKRRKNGKSFSKVIKEMYENNRSKDIMRFAGMFEKDEGFAKAMDKIAKSRKNFKLRRVKL